jgi:hypothetical protein
MLHLTRKNKHRFFSLTSLLLIVGFFFGSFNSTVFAQEISYQEAFASLKINRDRLLDTYAAHTGRADRYQAWNEMTNTQKGVFLTITDQLGRRTLMDPNYNHTATVYTPTQYDMDQGCDQMNGGFNDPPRDIDAEGAYIVPFDSDPGGGYAYVNGQWVPTPAYSGCSLVTAQECVARGHCSTSTLPRTDWDVALNHVTTLYAVNGNNGSGCGGGNNHRLFFSADDELIYKFRNIDFSAPLGWRRSEDLAGPHSPFTQSRETMHGKPRGQTHEWAWDYEAQYMNRPGVYGVYDPHLVEMDIDYNTAHDSNPECSYGGTYGRTKYENTWSSQGLGGSVEYSYSPY